MMTTIITVSKIFTQWNSIMNYMQTKHKLHVYKTAYHISKFAKAFQKDQKEVLESKRIIHMKGGVRNSWPDASTLPKNAGKRVPMSCLPTTFSNAMCQPSTPQCMTCSYFLPPFLDFGITCSYYAGTDQAGEWRTFHPSLVLLPWMKPARSQKADSIYDGTMHPKTPTWQSNSGQNIQQKSCQCSSFHTRSRATQSVVDSVDSEGNRILQAFSGRRRPTKPKSSCPSETFNLCDLCAIFSPVAHVYQTCLVSLNNIKEDNERYDWYVR